MTDTSQKASANSTVGMLERQTLLAAVTALCGPDRAAATLLQKAFARLVAADDWQTEIKQLERFGLSARYVHGQLRDILGGSGVQPQQQPQGSNPIIDILKSPQAKAVLAGIAASVFKRVTQGSSRMV